MSLNRFLFSLGIFLSSINLVANAQEKDGEKTFYFANGEIASKGNFKDGSPTGFWQSFFINGTLKSEGFWIDKKLDSTWKFYSEKGKIKRLIRYQKGIKSGTEISYDSLGQKLIEKTFFNDTIQGPAKEFFPNDSIRKKYSFENGKIHGELIEYDEEGNKILIEQYVHGNLRRREKLNQRNKEGLKKGIWKTFHSNGRVATETRFKDGKINGIIKKYNKKGSLKSIEKYKNGEKVAKDQAKELLKIDIRKTFFKGTNIVKSSGGYIDNLKHGVLREYSDSGEIIKSYLYREGNILAEGGVVDAGGNYQGNWIYFYENEDKLIRSKGQIINDLKEGEWIYYHKNGEIDQRGKYVKNRPEGDWIWYYENKEIRREESFRKGKEDGEVIEYDSTGVEILRGEFLDGFREGEWFYQMNDHIEKGQFRDGFKNGKWIFTFENNKIAFKGEYVNGLEIGKHEYYNREGVLTKTILYKNGRKHGDEVEYNDLGVPKFISTYKNDVLTKVNGQKIKD